MKRGGEPPPGGVDLDPLVEVALDIRRRGGVTVESFAGGVDALRIELRAEGVRLYAILENVRLLRRHDNCNGAATHKTITLSAP